MDRAFLQRVLDMADAIVIEQDIDGNVVYYNRYMEQLSGVPLEEARGKSWFDHFLPERDREQVRDLFSRVSAGMEHHGHINPIVTRSGEERLIEWSGATLDRKGEVLSVVSVGIDVTDRVELRASLAEKERLAAVGAVAAVFAHEVGNPLNSMVLHGELLKRKLRKHDVPEPVRKEIDAITGEVQRLHRLLLDFRSFYKQGQLDLAPLDVSALVGDVCQHQALPAAERRVQVTSQVSEPLPDIRVDRDKLKQVLLNLCRNGIEAMPNGGTLSIRVQGADDCLLIEVVDTGTGIDPELDIFKPFATSKTEGTGLGLPVVKQIVEAHGGTIEVESQPNQGTTFRLSLPLSPKE